MAAKPGTPGKAKRGFSEEEISIQGRSPPKAFPPSFPFFCVSSSVGVESIAVQCAHCLFAATGPDLALVRPTDAPNRATIWPLCQATGADRAKAGALSAARLDRATTTTTIEGYLSFSLSVSLLPYRLRDRLCLPPTPLCIFYYAAS